MDPDSDRFGSGAQHWPRTVATPEFSQQVGQSEADIFLEVANILTYNYSPPLNTT